MEEAKVEEKVQPSFGLLIQYLEKEHETTVDKQDMIDLEEKILRALDFSTCYVAPIAFLDRFLRIFGHDLK